jgi:hypothetical protein
MRRITLRVSDEVHTAFSEWADREQRSLHGQVLWVLQKALEGEQGRLRTKEVKPSHETQ